MDRAVGAGGLRSPPIGGAQRSEARGKEAGGGGLKFVIENEDQDCKQFALYRNDFRMHLALTAS
jgi:hypothetical protein